MTIIKSASKIVFILLSLSACVGFFVGKLSEGNFMMLALAAFAFYFAVKPTNTSGEIQK